MFPEIIFLPEAENPICGNADHLVPQIPGLIVILIYRRIQPVRIKADPFRRSKKLPCPGYGFLFKIITEGEIPKHFEICPVPGSLPDIFNIRRADALLAGGHSMSRRLLFTSKPSLHRRHARIDQEKRRIVLGNQGKAGQTKMSFCLKKAQVFFTQFIQTEFFHCC